jgi:hypothetical protein
MVLLVITLSLVVLLTFIIVAFFAATTVNRTVENSSSNAASARILAEGSIAAIEGELLNEIALGSNSTSTGDLTLYSPKTPADMVPKRALFVNQTDANFLNVIKQSGQSFGGSPSIFNFPSAASTDAASANGRRIDPVRWSAPMLTGGNFTAANAPKWIFVNTNGYSATANATTNPTIGRIAFNVYDVGGLIDINAAGHGSSISPEVVAFKGNPAAIDLTVLPGIKATADRSNKSNSWPPTWRLRGRWEAFVWNEKGEIGSLSYYTRSGWLQPFSYPNGIESDRKFSSRQDLIRYARAYPDTFEETGGLIPSLQYLTTFSRDLNQPSFAPEDVRPKVLPETPANYTPTTPGAMKEGNAFAFGYDDQVNLPFLQQRVGAPFTRYSLSSTGALQTTPAKVGEPLVLKRFPLSRLQLLADRNVVALPNSEIHRFFGLYRSSPNEPWRYNPDANSGGTPSTSSVLNLDEIQGREPNLFELLRAGIHWGSLGKSIGDTMAIVDSVDSVPNYQLAQIVASMIDQIDADSFPTIIEMDGREFYGSESLPYLTRIALLPKRQPFAGTQGVTAGIWIVPEIWNPYNPNSPTTGPAPARFRFTADGAVAAYFKQSTGGAPNHVTPLQLLAIGDRGITFTERNIPDPLMLSRPGIAGAAPIFAADSSPAGPTVNGGAQDPILGIFTGAIGRTGTDTSPYTSTRIANGIAFPPTTWVGHMGWGPSVELVTNLYLQYEDGGQWRTYASWKGWNRSFGETAHGAGAYLRHLSNFLNFNFQVGAVSDPRTFRFGILGNPHAQFRDNDAPFNGTLRPGVPDGARCGVAGGGNTRPFLPGLWTQNSEPTNTSDRIAHWKDTDGIQRKSMGAYASGTTGLAMADPESRPVILNRPFRSVAELSYVFRGAPWKNIDFFTKESGDSALLDIFCMDEDETPGALVTGHVNLNTRQPKVIEALIAGAAKTSQGTEPITTTEITRAAAELTNWTATKPFKNPANLIGRPISATEYEGFSDVLGNVFSGADGVHHYRRETVLRALSGSGTTRTWNVMVDVIAQTGRQTAGGFIVEGEYRTWTHLAIDRFTGKILDRNSESVIE